MAGFSYFRTVSFAECDPAGVAHFSRMACWVEEAEHEFLKQAGYPVQLDSPEALYWPRLSYAADYASPIRNGEDVKVILQGQPGTTSMTWTWSILHEEKLVAKGTMKTVCCRKMEGALSPVELPEALRLRVTAKR